MKVDYRVYVFTWRERLRGAAEAAGLTLAVNLLCYQSRWAFLLFFPVCFFYLKMKQQSLAKKRRQRLNFTFKDAVNALSVALKAGYSMENAISECIRDLRQIYSDEEPIVKEFCHIQSQLKVSVPVEALLWDFGKRSGVEDIQNFAGVYKIAKRSGGNLSQILQNTARTLNDKIDVQKEVETFVAAKRMEQSIMACVPCGIILYMQLMDPGFLSSLYGNPVGAAVMTLCLAGYGAAFWMGRKIVRIEV